MGNILDLIGGLFILFSAYNGFKSKSGTQFWALVALLAAVVLASSFSPSIAPSLTFLTDEKTRLMIAFVIVFLVVHQGIQFLAKLLNLNFSFGHMDKFLALVLSLVEASLFVGIIGLMLMSIPQMRFEVENTFLISKLASISKGIIYFLGGKGIL